MSYAKRMWCTTSLKNAVRKRNVAHNKNLVRNLSLVIPVLSLVACAKSAMRQFSGRLLDSQWCKSSGCLFTASQSMQPVLQASIKNLLAHISPGGRWAHTGCCAPIDQPPSLSGLPGNPDCHQGQSISNPRCEK